MVKPFEKVAFSLAPGTVSDIVETRFGYHLIKVIDKKSEQKIEYSKVHEKLTKYLKGQEVQKRLQSYIKELKAKADVKRIG